MKSNTRTKEQSPVTEYVYHKGNIRHTWDISSFAAINAATATTEAVSEITDYYLREEMAAPLINERSHIQINKALRRHHALIEAAHSSSGKLAMRDFPKYYRDAYIAANTTTKKKSATITVSSAYQKHHLIALSAMSGLLITRLLLTGHSRSHSRSTMSSFFAHEHLSREINTYSLYTTHYIHSALASEILIGNRYYRDITQNTGLREPLGRFGENFKSENITPEYVAATKRELCELYASEVSRLNHMEKQYKRGFVSLVSIQSDPLFTRLMTLFWRHSKQVMKIKDDHDKYKLPITDDNDSDSYSKNKYSEILEKFNEEKYIKCFFIISDVSEVPVMVPRLYDYDIAHLFDNANQNYVKYIRTMKNTQIRLANDGATAPFLSFAAIEPTMLAIEIAPKHGITYQTLSLKSCANHISSNHPVYGALRIRYRGHIPRTAVVLEAISQPRANYKHRNKKNTNPPIHEMIRRIRDISIIDLVNQYKRNVE